MRNFWKYIAYGLLILGLLTLVFYGYQLWPHFQLSNNEEAPDLNITGSIGDFVGGVIGTLFSLASILLVIETINNQNRQYNRDRFVHTFYEMLKIHNENVASMKISRSNGDDICSREVFTFLIDSYIEVYKLVSICTNNIINRNNENVASIKQMQTYLSDSQKRKILEMKIAYGYFFIGSETYHLQNPNVTEHNIENEVAEFIKRENKGIRGHNVLMGHYYRNLFQIVTMIANTDILCEEEKYTYIKQLRAQLDDQEQMLLYYNSMSELGHEWLTQNKTIKKVQDLCLIARFRMIKNYPFNLHQVGLSPREKFSMENDFLTREHLDFFEIA